MIRLILAAGLAFTLSTLLTRLTIDLLTRSNIGQPIREDGPEGHQVKAGTPTMGGIGIVLGALGGCWWPIEITPAWMQGLQKLMPTGWTMDALHKLISFQAGAASAIPNVVILLIASLVVAGLAINRFKYT